MIKIVFSDMDGTLLTPEEVLPPGFDEMMAELKKRNCTFVPASGRQYFSLIRSFEKYKDDMIFLAENGTLIKDGKGKIYYADKMPAENIHRIINKVREINQPYVVLCGVKSIYIEHTWDEKYLPECLKYFAKYEYIDKLENFEQLDDDIVKVAIADCDHFSADELVYQPMTKDLGKDMQVVLSSHLWVDVMNNGAGKGTSIKSLLEQLNIKPEEAVAFGDYLNDYTMMGAVYNSYAMENAHPDLKKVARFIAPSNAEFGVIKTVNKLMAEGKI